jgi:C4-type Zn-finger protein
MNCPNGHGKMKQVKLPPETHYETTHLRTLHICTVCGYEREVIGGGKNR